MQTTYNRPLIKIRQFLDSSNGDLSNDSLISSSDDCRWPKIQFNKQEKNVFCKPRIFTFCKFCVFAKFCHCFDDICCSFDDCSIYLLLFFVLDAFLIINFFIKNQSLIFRKNLDNQKSSKNHQFLSFFKKNAGARVLSSTFSFFDECFS